MTTKEAWLQMGWWVFIGFGAFGGLLYIAIQLYRILYFDQL